MSVISLRFHDLQKRLLEGGHWSVYTLAKILRLPAHAGREFDDFVARAPIREAWREFRDDYLYPLMLSHGKDPNHPQSDDAKELGSKNDFDGGRYERPNCTQTAARAKDALEQRDPKYALLAAVNKGEWVRRDHYVKFIVCVVTKFCRVGQRWEALNVEHLLKLCQITYHVLSTMVSDVIYKRALWYDRGATYPEAGAVQAANDEGGGDGAGLGQGRGGGGNGGGRGGGRAARREDGIVEGRDYGDEGGDDGDGERRGRGSHVAAARDEAGDWNSPGVERIEGLIRGGDDNGDNNNIDNGGPENREETVMPVPAVRRRQIYRASGFKRESRTPGVTGKKIAKTGLKAVKTERGVKKEKGIKSESGTAGCGLGATRLLPFVPKVRGKAFKMEPR